MLNPGDAPLDCRTRDSELLNTVYLVVRLEARRVRGENIEGVATRKKLQVRKKKGNVEESRICSGETMSIDICSRGVNQYSVVSDQCDTDSCVIALMLWKACPDIQS